MFEAIIKFSDGIEYRIEASDMKQLHEKCKPYIKKENVFAIYVYRLSYFGYFKNPLEKK